MTSFLNAVLPQDVGQGVPEDLIAVGMILAPVLLAGGLLVVLVSRYHQRRSRGRWS